MKQVVAALIVREGKILICQRSQDQAMPLQWEFPGGKVEAGEQRSAALRRELEEELGIQAEIGPELATVRHSYDQKTSVELRFFLVEHFQGEIRNRIFNQVRWVEKEAMPNYDFLEADVAVIRDVATGRIRLPGGCDR